VRPLLLFGLIALALSARSQNYWMIDNRSASIDAAMPDELARKLTAPYKTDVEKFRAIFSWVAAHIEYKVSRPAFAIAHNRASRQKPDTTWESRSLDERVAYNVLKNRFAVCDGYARLVKTLCDYAGISCNVIYGFAKSGDKNDKIFTTNHTWNAVYIDSAWRLADVTWASGYVSSFTNEYVKKYDDYYFLTRPKDFILSHYPEDPRWTLLDKTPVLKEYDYQPFRLKAFH
jgi:transglutaminase/protease-like cytokinesis protein 3